MVRASPGSAGAVPRLDHVPGEALEPERPWAQVIVRVVEGDRRSHPARGRQRVPHLLEAVG